MSTPVKMSAQIEQHISKALDQLKEADQLARHNPYMKARLHEAMNVVGRTLEEVTNKTLSAA
jgi:hypothetical protein